MRAARWLISAILLSGCAPSYTWFNPDLGPAAAAQQAQVDMTECTAIATQTIALPSQAEARIADSVEPTSYFVDGVTETFDIGAGHSYMGSYSGTIAANDGFYTGRGFLQGIATNQTNRDNMVQHQAYQARHDLTRKCMYNFGWQKLVSH